MAIDLKVFTLNCWGLRGISKNRKTRINAIAEVLSKKDYDVICLQEVWMDKDYQTIKLKLEEVLPYSHYFYSGVVGSGVCIFSKHFIEEAFFHHWSVNGYIHKLHHGDWWAGKGVGLCRLKIETDECNYHVNIYSAHLHAEYNRATDDYLAHRILQAYDTAQFILLTSGTADLVVLAGDLNTEPDDLAYRIILNVPGLTDSYLKANNTDQDGFATCESYLNSYTNSAAIRNRELGKRIDYVLYHPGSNVIKNGPKILTLIVF
ncbi:putative neutral sphingomyelinase isoform X2 [Cylas formicarius]|uniref:putative neutral sphingomyelinase isoform X2 n=1 Tax=Cylas formicarius TaxID=197179 RepID=UPI002958BDEA|nr:putative neutral sphingomyelinase isoform X2 [Cylas formicarius]